MALKANLMWLSLSFPGSQRQHALLDRCYINFEEQRMSERFGDSYDDYKRQV